MNEQREREVHPELLSLKEKLEPLIEEDRRELWFLKRKVKKNEALLVAMEENVKLEIPS